VLEVGARVKDSMIELLRRVMPRLSQVSEIAT
jgi:hypothetical protein